MDRSLNVRPTGGRAVMTPAASVADQCIVKPQPRTDLNHKLVEPGWAGELTDEELAHIQKRLFEEPKLAKLWGFRPGMKTRSEQAIRRVAMHGDPENRSLNRNLARQPARIMPVVALKS